MKKYLIAICLVAFSLSGNESESRNIFVKPESIGVPQFLYKILILSDWEKSQQGETVVVPAEDAAFIHFSKEDQLDRILTKYWSDVPQFVVLKIDTAQLEGELVYETNIGGSAKYYHLYDGSIPIRSIVESKVVQR